jgi:hypothetical protein
MIRRLTRTAEATPNTDAAFLASPPLATVDRQGRAREHAGSTWQPEFAVQTYKIGRCGSQCLHVRSLRYGARIGTAPNLSGDDMHDR